MTGLRHSPRPACILALDQGTTSSRAVLFQADGTVVAMAHKEFAQHYPRPGWVEHDPLEIWASQAAVMTEVISRAGVSAGEIAAIGITNQRETTVVWDRRSGRPVHPAIVWQDRRTAGICRRLKEEGLEPLFRDKTGLVLDPYFSGTKLAWILEHVAGVRAMAQRGDALFGTVDTWLLWNLTGGRVHATDASNASRTLLMDIHTGEWDERLLDALAIPRSMLPAIRASSEIYGHSDGREHPAGLAIAGMAGDQQAALFGQACFHPGMAKNTYGTGCFLLMNTGATPVRSANNLLTTVAWKTGPTLEYALEGSVFIGGAVIQWLRDELQLIASAAECDALAATVPDSNGVFLVPAFTGLGAPHWDPHARGLAIGLTRGTNRAHLCRAALEAVAFQSADLITAMERDSGIRLTELRVDGGASRSEPLLQFQADLLRVPVIRPDCIETTALGAACLAGLAVGVWGGRDEIAAQWRESRRFAAARPEAQMRQLQADWTRAVERSKAWEIA